VAAQGQAISTNFLKIKFFFQKEFGSKYQLYKQHEETVDHLTSGYPILAKNEYLMRNSKSVCVLGIKMT
jgi:hypothetical protein